MSQYVVNSQGDNGAQVESTGRVQVWIVPGVQVQVIPEQLRLLVYFEQPIYQYFNGTQLGSDYNGRVTAAYSLPLGSAEEE